MASKHITASIAKPSFKQFITENDVQFKVLAIAKNLLDADSIKPVADNTRKKTLNDLSVSSQQKVKFVDSSAGKWEVSVFTTPRKSAFIRIIPPPYSMNRSATLSDMQFYIPA